VEGRRRGGGADEEVGVKTRMRSGLEKMVRKDFCRRRDWRSHRLKAKACSRQLTTVTLNTPANLPYLTHIPHPFKTSSINPPNPHLPAKTPFHHHTYMPFLLPQPTNPHSKIPPTRHRERIMRVRRKREKRREGETVQGSEMKLFTLRDLGTSKQ